MKRFEAKPVLDVLRSKPISTLCAPPTLYRTMVLEPENAFQFKALKKAMGAGEMVNTEVMRAWKEKTGDCMICLLRYITIALLFVKGILQKTR